MSRSKRKPYYKSKMMTTQDYWSRIRRCWKQHLKKHYCDEDFYLKLPKEIINDWEYLDYRWLIEESKEKYINFYGELIDYGWTKEHVDKYSRK